MTALHFGVVMWTIAAICDIVHAVHLFLAEKATGLGAGHMKTLTASGLIAAHTGTDTRAAGSAVYLTQTAHLVEAVRGND